MTTENIKNQLKKLREKSKDSHHYLSADIRHSFMFDVIKLMQSLDMNQKDLAKKSGISKVTICKILKGEQNMTIETMAKIAMALDAKVEIKIY